MAATLRIVDESEYGPEPRDIPVPHGATVTVRRHRQGADVVIEPATEAAPGVQRFEPSERRLIQGMSVAFGMSGYAGLVLHEGNGHEHHFSIDAKSLLDFIRLIDPRPQLSSEDAGAPHLRDMGTTLVDKARARWLEAKAARLEADTAAEYSAPPDLGPLPAHSVTVDHEARRPGERILWVRFNDGCGRTAEIALPFGLALLLTSAIGNSLAERLPSPGRD